MPMGSPRFDHQIDPIRPLAGQHEINPPIHLVRYNLDDPLSFKGNFSSGKYALDEYLKAGWIFAVVFRERFRKGLRAIAGQYHLGTFVPPPPLQLDEAGLTAALQSALPALLARQLGRCRPP